MIGQPHKSSSITPKILWPALIVVVVGLGVVGYFFTQSDNPRIDNTNTVVNSEVNVNSLIIKSTNENLNTSGSPDSRVNQNTTSLENVPITTGEEEIPDTTSPEITNVKASDISVSGATIMWSTNEKSTSAVEYGVTKNYEFGLLSSTDMVTDHIISLTDLDQNTVYHFRVKSRDAGENEAISDNYSFTTETMYSLVETKSIGVPLANPVGIATDQDNLWLMFGTHNGNEHTLIYYDIDTNQVIKSFDYQNLIEVLGTGVYGITWDGENIWISVSGNTNKLVKVDSDSGEILWTWSSPTTLGPSDLAWDGSMIWVSSGSSQVFTVNPKDGGSSLFLTKGSRDNGIAIREDEVWVGDLFSNDVNIYNKETKVLEQTIKNAFSRNGKLSFYNGQVAVLNSAGVQFYTINPL